MLSLRGYSVVLLGLVLLTGLTVGISFIPLASGWHLTAGLTIGLAKAILVALFFMHVLHSPRLTWIIIAAAALWLLILISLTLTDYVSRGAIPGMPGH